MADLKQNGKSSQGRVSKWEVGKAAWPQRPLMLLWIPALSAAVTILLTIVIPLLREPLRNVACPVMAGLTGGQLVITNLTDQPLKFTVEFSSGTNGWGTKLMTIAPHAKTTVLVPSGAVNYEVRIPANGGAENGHSVVLSNSKYTDVTAFNDYMNALMKANNVASKCLFGGFVLTILLAIAVSIRIRQLRSSAPKRSSPEAPDVAGAGAGPVNTGLQTTTQSNPPDAGANVVNQLREEAAGGNAEAQFQLAGLYDNGQGVPQDHAMSFQWCENAAQAGLAAAQYYLGRKYLSGEGVAVNKVQGIAWIQKAADQDLQTAKDFLLRQSISGTSAGS